MNLPQTLTLIRSANLGGRPTKYDDSLIEQVEVYIQQAIDNKRLPTVEGYSIFIGVDDDTVVRWTNEREKDEQGNKLKKRRHPEFYAAIKRLKTIQKDMLINYGLSSPTPSTSIFSMFLLKANHGMVDAPNVLASKEKSNRDVIPILAGASNVPINNSDE